MYNPDITTDSEISRKLRMFEGGSLDDGEIMELFQELVDADRVPSKYKQLSNNLLKNGFIHDKEVRL